MKKILLYNIIFFTCLNSAFAWDNIWIFSGVKNMTKDKVREWKITIDDIPNILVNIINIWIWIAWTVSVLFIIVWAYKILFWSLEWDKTQWKNTIVAAIIWFIIASLAWVIIRLILDNFTSSLLT